MSRGQGRNQIVCWGSGGGEEVGGEVSAFKAKEGALGASLMAQMVKRLPAMRKTRVRSLGWEDPLEKGVATHSSILAWRIPRTEEPGRATVHGVTKSRTRLSDFTSLHFAFPNLQLLASVF